MNDDHLLRERAERAERERDAYRETLADFRARAERCQAAEAALALAERGRKMAEERQALVSLQRDEVLRDLAEARGLLEEWRKCECEGATMLYEDTRIFLAGRPAPAACTCGPGEGCAQCCTDSECVEHRHRPAPESPCPLCFNPSCLVHFTKRADLRPAPACDCIPENARLKWDHIPECASLQRADPRPEGDEP